MSSSDTAAADGGGDDGSGGGGRTKRIVFHLDDADSNPFAASQTPITTLSPTAQVVPTQQHVVSLTSDNKRVDSHDDIKQPFAAPLDAAVERVSSVKAENTRTISASAPSTLRSPKSVAAAGAISPYAISLLSSSAVFRSYHITDRTGKVDFQDIRLFATFPHDSIPDDSKETETAAAAALPSLHWGPPSSGRLLKSASYQSIALHSVERIIAGKQTATFQSPSSLVALLSSSRCFSIIAQTDTLHLEALSEDVRDAWVEQLAEAASVISQRTIAVERSANEAEDARVREQRRQRSIEETNRSYSESHLNKVYATASSKPASSTGKTAANSGAVKSISEILTSAPSPAPAPPIAAAAIPPLTVRAALPIFVTSEGVAREKTEMQMDMRLCLREMVTLHAQWIINAETDKLHPADSEFTDSEKRHTTHLPTPEHPSSNLEYKAYAGTIFTRLRYHYSIPDQAYLHSVAGSQGFADFVANSKSKSFFFYTYDGAYMMKSMTKEEVNFLRLHVLRPYYYHLIEHIDSLLSKIFGLYRIVKHGIKTYFMVMKNVFFGDKPIHVRFDLKGSTYGRQAKEKEKEQETPVLKDIDFNQGTMLHGQRLEPVYLRIGMKKQALVNMLTKDVILLSDLAIMDYSLLVGIHYRSRETNKNRSASIDGVTLNGSVSASGVVSASASDGQMNYGTKKHEFVVPRAAIQKVERMIENNSIAQAPTAITPRGMPSGSANDADNTEKSADSLSVPSESRRPQLSRYASSTFFTEDDGGVASVNEDGREGNEVYYLGIIDILQVYNTRKSLEYMVKAMTINANAVSVAPPKYYADRFLHAITERIKGVDDSWEK